MHGLLDTKGERERERDFAVHDMQGVMLGAVRQNDSETAYRTVRVRVDIIGHECAHQICR